MKQRWLLVVLGAWMAGTVVFAIVATENFYTVDRLLAERANPTFASGVGLIGQAATRELMRYLASELNRLYFQLWNGMQVGLGVLALWLVGFREQVRGAALARAALIAMLAIVALMTVWLTPAIVSLGRTLDFLPRDPSPPGMRRFWILHGTYTTLELIKLLVGAVATVGIVRNASPAGAEDPRARERAPKVQRPKP